MFFHLFLLLLLIEIHIAETREALIGRRRGLERERHFGVVGQVIGQVVAGEEIVAGEVGEHLAAHNLGIDIPEGNLAAALHLSGCHRASRRSASLWTGEGDLHLGKLLRGIVVEQFGILGSAIVHERDGLNRQTPGEIEILLLANGIVDGIACDRHMYVFHVAQVLVADGNATGIGLSCLQREFRRTELLIENA